MAYRTAPRDPRPQEQLDRAPAPPITSDALSRYRGSVLHPDRDTDFQGRRPNPTAYVADQLLVQGSGGGTALETLIEAAKATGHSIGTSVTAQDKRRDYVSSLGETALEELAAKVWVTRFHLQPDPSSTKPAPDAWAVLQKYREIADPNPGFRVGLNHLITLTAPGGIVGAPYFSGPGIPGAPYFTGPGTDGSPYFSGPGDGLPYFSGPGLGGRAPVTWLGRPPAPAPTSTAGRRPVVAVLDTGLGGHEWLQPPFATLGAQVNGHVIGLGSDVPDPELDGIVGDPLEGGLDRDAGHGTFIAGIIRQVCPDARVLAVRVMPSDGVVDEHQLTIALNMLLVRQAQAQLTGSSAEVIDVISLSLGYYHEQPEDVLYSSALSGTLRSFGELGVCVVAAAGNDHTSTPMFPAGLASTVSGTDQERSAVPLVSVGALNPSGTVAIFSNAGDWVSCHRPGANVVSTLPTSFDGSQQPAVATKDGRASIDPDDYASGFGIWSGTSFAAPVLAGEIAAHLFEHSDLDDVSPTAAVDRGWAAVEAEVGWTRP